MNKITETSKNIKQAMDEMNKDQSFLSEKIGVSQATISLWISGKREPRPKKIQKIADALGVPTDWIIFGKEYAERNKNNLKETAISKGVIFDLNEEITEVSQALIFLEMEELFFIPKKKLLKMTMEEVLHFANSVRKSVLKIKKM